MKNPRALGGHGVRFYRIDGAALKMKIIAWNQFLSSARKFWGVTCHTFKHFCCLTPRGWFFKVDIFCSVGLLGTGTLITMVILLKLQINVGGQIQFFAGRWQHDDDVIKLMTSTLTKLMYNWLPIQPCRPIVCGGEHLHLQEHRWGGGLFGSHMIGFQFFQPIVYCERFF